MLDKTRNEGPLCSKCKQPTDFHSVETLNRVSGDETVAIFVCHGCNRLMAKTIEKAGSVKGAAVG